MSITFQEAMEKINSGIIVACPLCFDGLEIDEAEQRMYCLKHGDCGWVTPNAEVTGAGGFIACVRVERRVREQLNHNERTKNET